MGVSQNVDLRVLLPCQGRGHVAHGEDDAVRRDGEGPARFVLHQDLSRLDLLKSGGYMNGDLIVPDDLPEHVGVGGAEAHDFEDIVLHLHDDGLLPLQGQVVGDLAAGEASADDDDLLPHGFISQEIIHRLHGIGAVEAGNGKSVDSLRDFLSSIGDSAVVLDDEELIKVHVHTDRPGDVLTEALTYGSLLTVKVENMREQHTSKLQEAETAGASVPPQKPEPEKRAPTQPLSIVSVCAGDGLTALFHELGADQVVTGGQTMNPSTEDILRAVELSAGAAEIVLPNNKNIVMAAQQCAGLTDKKVIVIPTASIPQGISAILAADLELPPEVNEAEMLEAIKRVSSISVTYAARDSSFDGLDIRAGQYLALLEGKLLCCTDSMEELADKVAEAVSQAELVSLFYGMDVSPEQAEAFSASLGGKLPEAELSLVAGGQPVYYYLISAE